MIITTDKKTGNPLKIVSEIFQDSNATLSLKFMTIETKECVYSFNYPILFQIYQEGEGTIIENEQLDIYAAGKSIAEAKNVLSFQFDHSYKRLNELNDGQLNPKLLLVKDYYTKLLH